MVLECYLKHGPCLSLKQLRIKVKISDAKAKYILSILVKRGYLKKAEDTDEYVLSEKIMMLA
jgi:DNA-binding IclR family transcriptional regulator